MLRKHQQTKQAMASRYELRPRPSALKASPDPSTSQGPVGVTKKKNTTQKRSTHAKNTHNLRSSPARVAKNTSPKRSRRPTSTAAAAIAQASVSRVSRSPSSSPTTSSSPRGTTPPTSPSPSDASTSLDYVVSYTQNSDEVPESGEEERLRQELEEYEQSRNSVPILRSPDFIGDTKRLVDLRGISVAEASRIVRVENLCKLLRLHNLPLWTERPLKDLLREYAESVDARRPLPPSRARVPSTSPQR